MGASLETSVLREADLDREACSETQQSSLDGACGCVLGSVRPCHFDKLEGAIDGREPTPLALFNTTVLWQGSCIFDECNAGLSCLA